METTKPPKPIPPPKPNKGLPTLPRKVTFKEINGGHMAKVKKVGMPVDIIPIITSRPPMPLPEDDGNRISFSDEIILAPPVPERHKHPPAPLTNVLKTLIENDLNTTPESPIVNLSNNIPHNDNEMAANSTLVAIEQLCSREIEYVDKLKKALRVKEQLSKRKLLHLNDIFGLMENIYFFHHDKFAPQLKQCTTVAEVACVFSNNINEFKIYIHDKWTKSENSAQFLENCQSLLDHSNLSENIYDCYKLTTNKFTEYFAYLQQLKSQSDANASNSIKKIIECLAEIVMQIAYVSTLKQITGLPIDLKTWGGLVKMINSFTVTSAKIKKIQSNVYFLENIVLFTNSQYQYNDHIFTAEIKLNPLINDPTKFILETTDKTFHLTAINAEIKQIWCRELTDILMSQLSNARRRQ